MFALLGLNHRSAPIEVRETLAIPESALPEVLQSLVDTHPIREAFVLSTCNRVEILVDVPSAAAGLAAIVDLLAARSTLTTEELDRFTYHFTGRAAIRHLFSVTCGLDSMILGEPQIAGQVKQAYKTAKLAGTTGVRVERLLQQALYTSKRARSETAISRMAVSVAFAAVELARQIFGKLEGRSALLLGAGKMSGLVGEHLAAHGVEDIVIASRSFTPARALAERLGGTAVHWDGALRHLETTDVVVSGTGAAGRVIDRDDVERASRRRRGRPLFLVDIAVPRDIDPAVDQLPNVYLYDVDALQEVVDHNLDERHKAAEDARKLIEGEVKAFEAWLASMEVSPTIHALREAAHELGRREVERFRRKLGPLAPEQHQAIDEMVHAIVQKFLHPPIRHLKRSVSKTGSVSSTRTFREIFGLEPGGGREAAGERRTGGKEDRPGPSRLLRGGRED